MADIKSQAKEMFNSIGICGDGQTIRRMVGISEDMLDYYYRLRSPSGDDACWSAVGWFIPLRGVIPDNAYAFLEHMFSLNGCPPAESFIETAATREQNVTMYGAESVERNERTLGQSENSK